MDLSEQKPGYGATMKSDGVIPVSSPPPKLKAFVARKEDLRVWE
jgi:hypothetical protein